MPPSSIPARSRSSPTHHPTVGRSPRSPATSGFAGRYLATRRWQPGCHTLLRRAPPHGPLRAGAPTDVRPPQHPRRHHTHPARRRPPRVRARSPPGRSRRCDPTQKGSSPPRPALGAEGVFARGEVVGEPGAGGGVEGVEEVERRSERPLALPMRRRPRTRARHPGCHRRVARYRRANPGVADERGDRPTAG